MVGVCAGDFEQVASVVGLDGFWIGGGGQKDARGFGVSAANGGDKGGA